MGRSNWDQRLFLSKDLSNRDIPSAHCSACVLGRFECVKLRNVEYHKQAQYSAVVISLSIRTSPPLPQSSVSPASIIRARVMRIHDAPLLELACWSIPTDDTLSTAPMCLHCCVLAWYSNSTMRTGKLYNLYMRDHDSEADRNQTSCLTFVTIVASYRYVCCAASCWIIKEPRRLNCSWVIRIKRFNSRVITYT